MGNHVGKDYLTKTPLRHLTSAKTREFSGFLIN